MAIGWQLGEICLLKVSKAAAKESDELTGQEAHVIAQAVGYFKVGCDPVSRFRGGLCMLPLFPNTDSSHVMPTLPRPVAVRMPMRSVRVTTGSSS